MVRIDVERDESKECDIKSSVNKIEPWIYSKNDKLVHSFLSFNFSMVSPNRSDNINRGEKKNGEDIDNSFMKNEFASTIISIRVWAHFQGPTSCSCDEIYEFLAIAICNILLSSFMFSDLSWFSLQTLLKRT